MYHTRRYVLLGDVLATDINGIPFEVSTLGKAKLTENFLRFYPRGYRNMNKEDGRPIRYEDTEKKWQVFTQLIPNQSLPVPVDGAIFYYRVIAEGNNIYKFRIAIAEEGKKEESTGTFNKRINTRAQEIFKASETSTVGTPVQG